MAITAWSAKVCSNAICLSLNGLHFLAAKHDRSDAFALAQQRHGQHRAVAYAARHLLTIREFSAFGGEKVVHMHRFAIKE